MAAKRPTAKCPGKPEPESVARERANTREMIESRFIDMFQPRTKIAAKRLLEDSRMMPLWEAGFCCGVAHMAIVEFEQSINRDAWARKSQRERNEWLARFEKVSEELLELMEEGPHPPYQWGFPARDNVLMNVAHRMGVDLPEAGTTEFFQKMLKLEHAADAENWTVADALRHYRDQQRIDAAPTQILKKPGDALAGRAEFVCRIAEQSRLSDAHLAVLWSVMADDESIDDRQVRRYRQNVRTVP